MVRRDGDDFDRATWLHEAKAMPKRTSKVKSRSIPTGKQAEAWETIYFKLYKCQLPIVEKAVENGGDLCSVLTSREAVGVDILPRHFYSEMPDIRNLKKETRWRAPLSLQGIPGETASQIGFVKECTARYKEKLPSLGIHRHAVEMNGSDEGYGEIEADLLYCFVRYLRPATIVQVGCGVSTAVCVLAARDEEYKPRIICIDPYPTEFLKNADKASIITLIPKKVQDLALECSKWTGEGDFSLLIPVMRWDRRGRPARLF